MWGVRGRALSHPQPLVRSGVRPGPTTHWLWLLGVRAREPVTNPTARALASWPFARWGRHEGARLGRLLTGCRVSGVGRSPTPNHSSVRACGQGPLPTGCGRGGFGRGPVTNPTAGTLAGWLCALWGRHEGAWGGRLLPGCGASGVGRSPTPNHSSVRACGQGPLPTGCGRGGSGRGPVTNPTVRALASWTCALWGRHEGARGGRLLPGCGASGDGRSPTPDLSSVRACGRGPLPTGCGCGGCGHGDPSPTPQRALLRAGFARCGGGMRVPGGGASCLGVGCPGSGALPPPTTCLFGRLAGAHYPLAVDAGGAGMKTRHQPHSARSCERALRAVGAARGHPGGGRLLPGCGASGDGRSPTPDHSSVRACGRGALPTGCGCGGCGHGDPSPSSQRALLRAGFACSGGGMRMPGGGAPPAWVPGVRGRALSHLRPLVRSGVRPGPTTHWLWVRGVRARGPVTNPSVHALASWLCALWGQHEGARGGASCLVVGRPATSALPPPTSRPFRRAAGAHYPLAVGAGTPGVGTSHQLHSAHSCELALRAVGVA